MDIGLFADAALAAGASIPVRLDGVAFSSSTVWLIVAGLFFSALAASIFSITTAVVRQMATPDRHMEPMMAINLTLTSAMAAVGSLAGGLIGSHFGPAGGIGVGAAVFMATGFGAVGRHLGAIESYHSPFLESMGVARRGSPAARRSDVSNLREQRPQHALLTRLAPADNAIETPTTPHCTIPSCGNPHLRLCSYIDSKAQQCPTLWCPTHAAIVDGQCFCRRHDMLLRTLGLKVGQGQHLPDINDWAASLTVWVRGEFDDRLRQMLASQYPAAAGFTIIAGRVARGTGKDGPFWTAPWLVDRHDRTVVTVRLSVTEDNDKMVIVAVDTKEVARGIPPWIARRASVYMVDAAVDSDDRERFYAALLNKVQTALPR